MPADHSSYQASRLERSGTKSPFVLARRASERDRLKTVLRINPYFDHIATVTSVVTQQLRQFRGNRALFDRCIKGSPSTQEDSLGIYSLFEQSLMLSFGPTAYGQRSEVDTILSSALSGRHVG